MQTGLCQEVLANGGTDGKHIADMLDDGGKGNGHDGQDSGKHQRCVAVLEHSQDGAVLADGETHPCRFAEGRKIDQAHAGCNDIRRHDTQQYGDNLDDTLAPYRRDDDGDDGDDGQQPV